MPVSNPTDRPIRTDTTGPAAPAAPAANAGTPAPAAQTGTPAPAAGWSPGGPAIRRPVAADVGTTGPAVSTPGGQPVIPSLATLYPGGANGDFGKLNPPGKTFPVLPSVADLVKTPDSLDLTTVNREFNPVASRGAGPAYTDPQQMFEGKAVIPTRDIIGGVLKSLGPQGEALAPMLDALPKTSVVRTPAQEFNINAEPGQVDKPGNRIIFYGGSHEQASDVQGTVSDVDKLAMKLGDKGIRVMKEMVHFNGPAQGGTMQDIVGDGVGGATHGGGFSSGYIDGKQTSVYSDWPANYGRLSNDNRTYNAQLFAINYQGGVEKPLPRDTQVQYKNNADMWDAVLGAVVPFTGSDPDPRHTNYQYNPLDVYDQASLKSVAHDAATLDWNEFKKNHGAFYCAEGQYVVSNMGPNEDTLLKKSLFEKNPDGTKTKLGDMIDTFQQAYPAGSSVEENRKHPEVGWKHLVDTGKITQEMYDNLKRTGRLATSLDWIPEETQGWQKFNPISKNGLIAEPMTVGTLAWSLMHRYMPRDGIAAQLSSDMTNAYKTGTAEQKKSIEMLLGGNDPNTPTGRAALDAFTFKAATATMGQMLSNDDFKKNLFKQAGIEEITTDADKKKLTDAYDAYVNVFMTAKNQQELDSGLKVADDALRNLQVHRSKVDERGQPNGEIVESTMLYAAPPSIAAWAQNPMFSGGPQVLQYIATAMHADQEKKPAAPAQ
jgi:hypothetical protein